MIPRVSLFGDRAVLIQWDADDYDAAINAHALGLADHLRATKRFVEVVPGYDSVMVQFDPTRLTARDAKLIIDRELPNAPTTAPDGPTVEIPVHYGGDHGPDMATICDSSGHSEAEVIALHAESPYRVCMMGFIPGFAFLSDVPSALAHPRHARPRAHVPPGSVGIAGWQTGIYGLGSPGGWQIIGATPLSIFDARRDAPFLLRPGDSVRFIPS